MEYQKPESFTLSFIKKNKQLLYGSALIIIIPLLVIANSLVFFNLFTKTLDIELHQRAITIGEITSTIVSDKINDTEVLQETISNIVQESPELIFLEIITQSESGLIVWVSTEENNIGKKDTNPATVLSLQTGRAIAARSSSPDGNEQFWSVVYPLKDNLGNDVLMTMQLSTAAQEVAARKVLWQSFMLLFGIVLVIMLLLLVNSRLFQYAVLYRKLRSVDQAKDDFISVASHELRTPITALRNYFSLLEEGSYGKISKQIKDSIEFMSGNIGRLQSLVEDLLNVSRIQQGKVKIDTKDVDVSQVIANVVRQLKPNTRKKGLKLTARIEKSSMVKADEDKLKQALINLIGNAIKYTEKGSIEISIHEEMGKAMINIKDTGIGMTQQEQERLFEKFYRIKNDQTRMITGTGLGLWITKAIIEMMNGKIYIDSIKGTGSQVAISLPLTKSK